MLEDWRHRPSRVHQLAPACAVAHQEQGALLARTILQLEEEPVGLIGALLGQRLTEGSISESGAKKLEATIAFPSVTLKPMPVDCAVVAAGWDNLALGNVQSQALFA